MRRTRLKILGNERDYGVCKHLMERADLLSTFITLEVDESHFMDDKTCLRASINFWLLRNDTGSGAGD
jgi:hypothetical protein